MAGMCLGGAIGLPGRVNTSPFIVVDYNLLDVGQAVCSVGQILVLVRWLPLWALQVQHVP